MARIRVLEKDKCIQCFDGGTVSNILEDLRVAVRMIIKLVLKK